METYLRKAITVSIDTLWPDPNNPRLALPDPPGYRDPDKLFSDEARTQIFDDLGEDAYTVDDLVGAIVGQGWMPIDNIIVWQHPTTMAATWWSRVTGAVSLWSESAQTNSRRRSRSSNG